MPGTRKGVKQRSPSSSAGLQKPARSEGPRSSSTDRKSTQKARERGLAAQLRRRPRPAWIVITAHALVLGIALVLYALPHHVIARKDVALGVESSRYGVHAHTPEPTPPGPTPQALPSEDGAPEAEATPEVTAEPTPEPVGSFRNKFADKFTDGEVIETDNSYQSANVNVTFRRKYFDELKSRVYFVDIYVADISCLRSVFAEETFGVGNKEWITKVARRVHSVATLNGDYYGSRSIGVVVRNGTLYRDKKNIRDVAVLYWDGTFETIPPEQFDAMTAMANGAYQCWHFGPRLLDDYGHAMTKFNADTRMLKRQPRSAFGYFEPGHYCFVVVDGRLTESWGVKMEDLSSVMEGLGCKAAYNLDGGQTSLLAKGDKMVNRPSGGGHSSSDYIVVIDEVID